MHTRNKKARWPVLLLAALAEAATAQVQDLADPQRSVFTAFPEADGYQAVVRDIDVAARRSIEAALPFRVHFNELGAHTIYVALRGRQPLGLLYARREESAWGLAAVEWALTLDLQVVGFRFERARSNRPTPVETSEFGRQLVGRGRRELVALLQDDGSLRPDTPGLLAGDEDLNALLVRSGLKAIVIADAVWPHELAKLRDRALGIQAFPNSVHWRRLWPRDAAAAAPAPTPALDLMVRAFNAGGQPLGVVAEGRIAGDGGDRRLRLVVDSNGTVLEVVPLGGAVLGDEAPQSRGLPLPTVAARSSALAPLARQLHEILAGVPAASPR